MKNYLGETILDVRDTEFKDYTPSDWAMYFIENYGQFDGDHHKAWVLDQVARILKGTPVIIKEARWLNGHSEYRITVDEDNLSKEYNDWIKEMLGEYYPDDDEYEYSYETGIAP